MVSETQYTIPGASLPATQPGTSTPAYKMERRASAQMSLPVLRFEKSIHNLVIQMMLSTVPFKMRTQLTYICIFIRRLQIRVATSPALATHLSPAAASGSWTSTRTLPTTTPDWSTSAVSITSTAILTGCWPGDSLATSGTTLQGGKSDHCNPIIQKKFSLRSNLHFHSYTKKVSPRSAHPFCR